MDKPELSYDGCGINSREHGRIFTAARHHKDNGGGFILDDKERERVGVLMASAPELLEALRQYQAAFDALFSHCLSNGVFSQQGKPFDCTAVNDANSSACAAIAKATLKL